jgi:hypothetical protein
VANPSRVALAESSSPPSFRLVDVLLTLVLPVTGEPVGFLNRRFLLLGAVPHAQAIAPIRPPW